jgi:hypothetical protein
MRAAIGFVSFIALLIASGAACGGRTSALPLTGGGSDGEGGGTNSGSGGSHGGSSGSSGGSVASGSGSGGDNGSSSGGNGGSRDDGGLATDAALPPLDAALASLDAAPPGLAGFALIINDVVQNPMTCQGSDWEFAPYPAGTNCGYSNCSGVESVILVNTGALPMAVVAGYVWFVGGAYAPGVQPSPAESPGGASFQTGVLGPGDRLDITSVYAGRTVAILGSAEPFSDPDGAYVNDEGTMPWPTGVAGSGGASQMHVAEIQVWRSCQLPTILWQ